VYSKTSTMVQAAIFAALAIVFNMVFYYIPVLAIFINLVLPLPIAICGMRCGLRWSIMSLIVATALVGMLINPMHALFFIGVYGIMGVVLGECMHRRYLPGKLILVSSVGAFVGFAINLALAFTVMGINPIETMFSSLDKALPEMERSMASFGMTPEQAARAKEDFAGTLDIVKIILPGAFVLMAPIVAFINYWLGRKILGRLGEKFPPIPDFTEFNVPAISLLGYGLGLFGLQYFNYAGQNGSVPYLICANVYAVCSMLLVLQGLSVAKWFCRKKGYSNFAFGVVTLLCFAAPLFSLAATFVGGYDLLFHFREKKK